MEPMTDAQVKPAIETFAAAFFNDPLMDIMSPDPKRRHAVSSWFFNVGIKYGRRWGHVWCNEDATAGAVWFPPEDSHLKINRFVRCGFGAAPFKLGIRPLMTMLSTLSAGDRFHKAVKGPNWYLLGIGTHPDRQGQGLGSALIKMGTSRADETNASCYLETMTEDNVRFYRKHGFEVSGEAPAGKHTVYAMVRPPQG